jgi:hypothetical protein
MAEKSIAVDPVCDHVNDNKKTSWVLRLFAVKMCIECVNQGSLHERIINRKTYWKIVDDTAKY